MDSIGASHTWWWKFFQDSVSQFSFFLHVNCILQAAWRIWSPLSLGTYSYSSWQEKKKEPKKNSDWTNIKDMAVPDPSLWPGAWGLLNHLARVGGRQPPPLIRKNNSSMKEELHYYWKEGRGLGRQKQQFSHNSHGFTWLMMKKFLSIENFTIYETLS